MRKFFTAVSLCPLPFVLCSSVEAQQAKTIYRLGYISNRAEMGPNEQALREALRELGYIEGGKPRSSSGDLRADNWTGTLK